MVILPSIMKMFVLDVVQKGHWSRICRELEHLCQLYKAFQKGKGKETNLAEHCDPKDDSTHLDASYLTDDFENGCDSDGN